MIKRDEEALICDFAETYHIYDYKGLPLNMVAPLAVGLRDNSRIKMIMSGVQAPIEVMLMAAMVDKLNILVWAQTKDAAKGKNRPKSIIEAFIPKETKTTTYESGEDFIKAREKLLQTSQEVK